MTPSPSYLHHFIQCNRFDPADFIPFCLNHEQYGLMKRSLAHALAEHMPCFRLSNDDIELSPELIDFASRSAALSDATAWMAERFGKKRRDELYPVMKSWGEAPLAQIDRVAVGWFGFKAWGIHVNGFVRKRDGIHLWVGERAADRLIDPGKLDNMIGGGQPIGLSIEENLCKEAQEEAGIDRDRALQAKRVRSVSYRQERPEGLRQDTLFTFDLELEEGFTPVNTDGEVARFTLLPLAEVDRLVRTTDRFKFNCNLIIIDFMIRHGFITPTHPEFDEINRWLDI